VRHQVEIDTLPDQGVAGAEEILDRVERLDDVRPETCLFEDLPESRRLRAFARRNGAFGQSPARFAPCGDERNIGDALAY